jgi:hypothetical protein
MKNTTIRPKQRKLAQIYLSGKPYKDIAAEVGMNTENPSQAVHNRLQDIGTQAAIAELITESNVISQLTTDKILFHIQKLALDESLKPKEREGYLRMLAEYKALLKQVNLNETVTSSDALVEQAQAALDTLKRSVAHDAIHATTDMNCVAQVNVVNAEHAANVVSIEGEKVATPSGSSQELHPSGESEKD